jgi:hypothetical protein
MRASPPSRGDRRRRASFAGIRPEPPDAGFSHRDRREGQNRRWRSWQRGTPDAAGLRVTALSVAVMVDDLAMAELLLAGAPIPTACHPPSSR